MGAESAFVRFRNFMTPGRTLIALFLIFIALPGAIVWSGVANFGPGRGAGAKGSDAAESKEPSKASSDLEIASAKAKALMSSASGEGSSKGTGGSGGGAAPESNEKASKEKPVQVGLPNINPVQVRPPVAQPMPTANQEATSVPSQPLASANSSAGPSPTVPVAPSPSAQQAAAASLTSESPNKARQIQPPSLEDKVRAALLSRLQGGGEVTITYGGDIVDRSAAPQAKGNTGK